MGSACCHEVRLETLRFRPPKSHFCKVRFAIPSEMPAAWQRIMQDIKGVNAPSLPDSERCQQRSKSLRR